MNTIFRRIRMSAVVPLLMVSLHGCSQYAVTFNERVVYSPPPLFRDFKVADVRLRTCIDQTIEDQQITDPAQLKHLSCTYAGIESLAGIETFTQLRVLNLANNQLTDLAPLAGLGQLTHLDVQANHLTDVAAVLSAIHLENANFSENPHLPCRDLLQLAKNTKGKLILPAQCR